MIICWIDVGAKWALVIKGATCNYNSYRFSFNQWMQEAYKFLTEKIQKYEPLVIVIGEAMWAKATVKQHSKYYWIIELIAEQNKIQVIYCNDLQARKSVLQWSHYHSLTEKTKAWTFKVLTWKEAKQWVMNHFKEADSDIADAKLFCEWYINNIK